MTDSSTTACFWVSTGKEMLIKVKFNNQYIKINTRNKNERKQLCIQGMREKCDVFLYESESQSVVYNSLRPHCWWPARLLCPWNSPGQKTGVGSCFLLQGIFLTKESNSGPLPCRQILYQWSHQGSPKILEWVAYPFSRGSSWPRNWTGVSPLQVDSLPTELSGKNKSGI